MESLRLLQRQALQQLLHARQFRPQSHQLQLPMRTVRQISSRSKPTSSSSSSSSSSLLSNQLRGLHTAGRAFFPRTRPFTRGTVRFKSRTTRWSSTSAGAAASEANPSLSQRLRKLSREYGWSAVGVYLALSALDFPFCFLAVRLLGTDRIGHWEHVVISKVKELVAMVWPAAGETMDGIHQQGGRILEEGISRVEKATGTEVEEGKRILELDEQGEGSGLSEVVDHGYRDAERANTGANASIWTQLALAYAIHKSFIFIRVPLTAAVTPKVVKTLRSWGWNIGKRPAKKVVTSPASTSGSSPAANSGSGVSGTGVNTKASGVKSD